MYNNLYFAPGSVLGREKGDVTHVGIVADYGAVLHNTPEKGEHIATIEAFADGKEVKVLEHHPLTQVLIERMKSMLAKPASYGPLNNCEDTVSKIVTGKSGSAQRKKVIEGVIAVVGISVAVAAAITLVVAGVSALVRKK